MIVSEVVASRAKSAIRDYLTPSVIPRLMTQEKRQIMLLLFEIEKEIQRLDVLTKEESKRSIVRPCTA